jgi:hypothetical protein
VEGVFELVFMLALGAYALYEGVQAIRKKEVVYKRSANIVYKPPSAYYYLMTGALWACAVIMLAVAAIKVLPGLLE